MARPESKPGWLNMLHILRSVENLLRDLGQGSDSLQNAGFRA
jgi:hypothetical protein